MCFTLKKKTKTNPNKNQTNTEGEGKKQQHRTEPALFPTVVILSYKMKQDVFVK